MGWSWRSTLHVWKQQCKERWSCALWSAHLFPHSGSCMGLTECFILLKPAPSKCWVQQLNPAQLGAGILGSVSAWIWHLLYPWFHRYKSSCFSPSCCPAVGDHGTSSFGHSIVFAYMDFRACCDIRLCCWLGCFSKKEGNKFVQFRSRNSCKERQVFICLFTSFLDETTASLCLPLKKCIYLLITEVEWEWSREQSNCPTKMPRKSKYKNLCVCLSWK